MAFLKISGLDGRLVVSTVEIPLTQGQVALVDVEDYSLVSIHHWHAQKNYRTFYAVTNIVRPDGKRVLLQMHRLILGVDNGIRVDHRNRKGTDNRRENLREATNQENGRNTRIRSDSKSGFKGVTWCHASKKWRARICISGNQKLLGYFTDPRDAAGAYDEAALKYFGEFAYQNLVGRS